RRPRHTLGLLQLGPRADRAFEDHFASLGFDDNCLRVEFGVALERLLDFALDLRRLSPWLERDQIVDALDAPQSAHCLLGSIALELPFCLAFEVDPAVLDDDLYVLPGV